MNSVEVEVMFEHVSQNVVKNDIDISAQDHEKSCSYIMTRKNVVNEPLNMNMFGTSKSNGLKIYHFPSSKTYFGDFANFQTQKYGQRSIFSSNSQTWSWTFLDYVRLRPKYLHKTLQTLTLSKADIKVSLTRAEGHVDFRCFQDHPDPFHVQSFYSFILIGGLEYEFYDFPYIGNNSGYICKLWTVYISVSIILWSIDLGSMLPNHVEHMPTAAGAPGSRWGGFAKKHRTTVFKPFKIQELMIDAVLQPGAPQSDFWMISPSGTIGYWKIQWSSLLAMENNHNLTIT